MDSPESSKTVASSSASPSLQESPFFSYLRNLSPIQPPKVAHITQGFSELNIPTPPPVFTSPRLNPQPEILSLKRSQFPRPFKGELSHENENKRGLCTSISDISDLPVIKLMDGLVPCTKKMSEDKGRMPIQTCSPSGCVDEYLADPEDDGATSSGSALKQDNVPETLQSGCTLSKEVTLDDGDQTGKDMETKMTPSEKTEEDLKKSLLPSKLGKQKDGEGQSDITSDKINDVVLFDSSHKPASCSENCQSFELQDLNRQISEGGENSESGHELQVLPETVQILNACDNHSEQSGTISCGPVENREAFQNQRGARRRCLQFDAAEARRKYTSEGHCILKPVDLFPLPRLPETQMEVGLVDSSHMDIETSGSNHIVNSSQPLVSNLSLCPAKTPEGDVSKLNRSVGHSDNTVRKTPLSSGIGLHLNSIVNIAPTDRSEIRSMNSAENGFPNAHKEQSPPLLEQHLHEKSRSSSLPTIGTKMFLTRENSASFRFPPEKLDRVDESNQLSPKKKRKRDLAEPEGCKRCNCRRSKCLKLYCECFAAGIYCAEPCACQECFNKPEYVDTVLETRHQIESRNPLAFAPKVVRRASGSPANIGKSNDRVTPSSARHKRGCNCKKSQCLKKYCECYQGGVGCSDGCRCEGCKNMFGAKEGYGEINEMSFRKDGDDSLEELSDGKLVMGERSNFLQPEHSQPYNLTPATPLFEKSNHGKDVSRSRVPARRCLPSPESDANILSSYSKSPRSPRNSGQHSSQRNTRGGVDIVFYDQELEFSATGRIEQFSPRWDGLEDLCDLSPLPRVSPRVTTISSSSNADCGTVSRIQLQGSVRLSGSLRWRCSPTTPMPQLGGNKLPTQPSSSGYNILEDETPDILKDNRTPIKAVKVSSPNQKRVSPPHARLKELRSSISPGMRSGRKFVLQSISSFPPLTPCSDPKGSSSTDKRTE